MTDGDWNNDDLLHEGHIVRGTILFRRGDVQAAASELLAAAAASDTSGRPDVDLALALVKAGQDEAVLTYLRAIASWGSAEPD
jgi:Flp pilus assembly protein TadD